MDDPGAGCRPDLVLGTESSRREGQRNGDDRKQACSARKHSAASSWCGFMMSNETVDAGCKINASCVEGHYKHASFCCLALDLGVDQFELNPEETMNHSQLLLATDRFHVDEVTRQLPGGQTRTRAIVRHPGAVAIIPMVDADHVCLIKNYRVSVEQTLLEIPAGTLEGNATPLDTARRELKEETGYEASSLKQIAWFYLSPGVLDEKMAIFVAEGLSAGKPERELGEEIENRVVAWDDAIGMIFSGEITDAKTIAGLLIYDGTRRK
jgi:ADP-ribose pyrophosphatase